MQAVTFLQPRDAADHRHAHFIIIIIIIIVVVVVVVILFAQQYNSTRFYIDAVERSRTATSDKNTSSCPKTFSKTVTYGVHNYDTSKILKTNKKTGKSVFSMLSFEHF